MNTLQISPRVRGEIDPRTRPGYVALTVSDLRLQIDFYSNTLGMQVLEQADDQVWLGSGGIGLLHLTRQAEARRYRGTSGLYHFAVLLPTQKELARVVRRLMDMGISNYPTDHIMTKTTYLEDPEGNQIELYAESPEDGAMGIIAGEFKAQRADGTPSDGREPMDVPLLLRELQPEDDINQPLPPETRIGHVHLHVSDLGKAMHFYHDIIGFDDMGIARMFRMGMVSAGGYHHHIGFNTWMGEAARPQPKDALGLRHFTFLLPTQAGLDAVKDRVDGAGLRATPFKDGFGVDDPFGNTIVLSLTGDSDQSG